MISDFYSSVFQKRFVQNNIETDRTLLKFIRYLQVVS